MKTTRLHLNGEILNVDPLKSGMRLECPLSVLEILVRALRQEKNRDI